MDFDFPEETEACASVTSAFLQASSAGSAKSKGFASFVTAATLAACLGHLQFESACRSSLLCTLLRMSEGT